MCAEHDINATIESVDIMSMAPPSLLANGLYCIAVHLSL